MSGPLQDRLRRPLRNLRLSVTDRCNLRCAYCMPDEDYTWFKDPQVLSFDEIAHLVDRFIAVGVDKVRLTGGEPLVRRELPVLVRRLAQRPGLKDLALTTNGVLLAAHAEALKQAGLHRITVSLDTLKPATFAQLTRRETHAQVLAGIEAARLAGFPGGLKLDTVLMRGLNDDEVAPLLDFAASVGAELRFIEYMDVGGATRWSPAQVVSQAELLERLTADFGAPVPLPNRGSAPAERFRLPDGRTFGVVASTTQPFCRDCDRSRLTADGQWFSCLYATKGVDVRTALRSGASDDELEALLRGTWERREDRGAELRHGLRDARGPLLTQGELADLPHLQMHRRGG